MATAIRLPAARLLSLCLSMSFFLALAEPAGAQERTADYPTRAVRIVVAFPPGGTPDVLARLVGQKLADHFGQPFVVDNRPGGNTLIGTDAVAKAPADGHTLLSMSSAHVTTPLLVPTPYDALADFTPVATLAASDFLLAVHPSVRANTLKELISEAKARPGQLNYASSGNAGAPHLSGELMNLQAGIRLTHVPYKGMGPAVTDLLTGQVQLAFAPVVNFLQHVKAGKLKAIAISGSRVPVLPDVPTFAEAGLPSFEARAWYGMVGPRGLPAPVVNALSTQAARTLAQADVRDKLAALGTTPLIASPVQFGALMKADSARMAEVIRSAGIKLEN